MFIGLVSVMKTNDIESRFRRGLIAFLVLLLVSYLAYKAWHISLALDAYQGQVLQGTTGAAK